MQNCDNKLEYGDIILFKPSSLLGSLISFIDGSEYSHVGMFIEYKNGVPLFIESHEKKNGVVITKLQEWQNYTVKKTLIKPRRKREVLNMLGTSYDNSMLWWIFKAKVFSLKQENNDEKSLICSEFIDWCFNYQVGHGYVATPKTFNDSKLFI